MSSSVRTIVDLPDEQLEGLARVCGELQVSRAEAVRRAVERMNKDYSPARDDVGFVIWRGKGIDSRRYVEKMRSEWGDR
jgi:metal-responsive CopG/Arc/MetJ family transcriptional regulator